MKLFAHWKRRRWKFDIEREGDRLVIRQGKSMLEMHLDASSEGIRSVLLGSRKLDFGWTREGERYEIVIHGTPYEIAVRDLRSEELARMRRAPDGPVQAEVRAPIPGRVRRLLTREGANVRRGCPLLTLEAMKMENEICSPVDGHVREIRIREGATVERNAVLLVVGQ